ncbi:hypothetical protein HID58_069460 [Brassica napus]|uniref:Uncharacterized protein n=1 Tax=Brassica napus TaxID=3708 RepID=A0ABQ7YW45_BRANA|nr:hypothetical protein HID58_069460 [Brassica napus]
MTLVYLLFVSKLMQQKVTKDEKCVRNLATYEGLSLENESLGLVLENQVTTATFLSFNLAQAEEGTTSVLDGLDTHRELTGQVKERRDREEELGGATSLYDDFVGVDKEAGLREDARVEMIVGERRNNLASSRSVYFVKLGPGQSTETQSLGVLKDARLKERDLGRLLVTSKPIADKAMSPCCLNL